MNDLWIHRYRHSSGRHGALLRQDSGYADLHPWVELGDEPLDLQLAALKAGRPFRLGDRALVHLELDGRARREKRSLFEGLSIPASHYTWPGFINPSADAGMLQSAAARGFRRVKFKLGRNPASEIRQLRNLEGALLEVRLEARFDFNERLSPAAIVSFIEQLGGAWRNLIDFIEDPWPYETASWKRFHDTTNHRLAVDRALTRIEGRFPGARLLVIKPAVVDPLAWIPPDGMPPQPLVITSYLDHPVGQMMAAWFAARMQAERRVLLEDCGLNTHGLSGQDDFSEQIRENGASFLPPFGTGIGFDDLLANLNWTRP